MAVRHLALTSGPSSASAREIAEQYDIPIELMAKVLQRLVRAGLLISTQGTRGGYTLSRPSSAISVGDVIQAIDGPFTVTACSSEKIDCEQYSKCSIRDPLWQIRERITAALDTVTIAEMAADSDAATAPVAHAAVIRR
jgi:Rrf2 family protein